MITVREIDVTETYRLRREVLRRGTTSSLVEFVGDSAGMHHGADHDRAGLVGIASWLPIDDADHGDGRVYQLRGMAVDSEWHGQGIGTRLLSAGLSALRARGVRHVVANARMSALDFYVASGWELVGEQYLDETTTGLPHHAVRIRLGHPPA